MRIPRNAGRLFRIILASQFIIRERNCKNWFWEQKGTRNCKSWLPERNRFLLKPHPLTNTEIKPYDQNEPNFIGVYSRNKLPQKI